MKPPSLLHALTLAATLASPALAEPREDANRKIVVDFYEMAFNRHQPTAAAKAYIGDVYIQHNPDVPNGAAAFYGYFEDFFRKNPQSQARIYRVMADGDLVALHVHSQVNPNDPGEAIVDIFRVENGKIVEHFDVVQAVPKTTANGNSLFDGQNAD